MSSTNYPKGCMMNPYTEEEAAALSVWSGGWVHFAAHNNCYYDHERNIYSEAGSRLGEIHYPFSGNLYLELLGLGIWIGGYVLFDNEPAPLYVESAIVLDDGNDDGELGAGSESEGCGCGQEGCGCGQEGCGCGSDEIGEDEEIGSEIDDDDDRFKHSIRIGAGETTFVIPSAQETAFIEIVVHATWTEGTYYPLAGYSTSHISISYYSHFSYGQYTYTNNTFRGSAHWVNHLRFRFRIRFYAKYENKLLACEVDNEQETQSGNGCGSLA